MRGKLLTGIAASTLLLFTACAGMGTAEREKAYGNSSPVITASFAAKEVKQGDDWLVYLKATDPDGDMDGILCSIQQTSGDPYFESLIRVPDDQKKNLSGYIHLDTEGPRGPINLKLWVYIRDKAGHKSKPVTFWLSFEPRDPRRKIVQEAPPSGVFEKRDLGRIPIVLNTEEDW